MGITVEAALSFGICVTEDDPWIDQDYPDGPWQYIEDKMYDTEEMQGVWDGYLAPAGSYEYTTAWVLPIKSFETNWTEVTPVEIENLDVPSDKIDKVIAWCKRQGLEENLSWYLTCAMS